MNWNNQDNKKYIGRLDDMFVSRTEGYEMNYAIDDWLKSRNCALTDGHRQLVRNYINAYPGPVPVLRAALYTWLDANVPGKR